MTGELIAVTCALLAMMVLCGWLVWEVTSISRETRKNQSTHVELIEKLSQLAVSRDALTYQALRAVDSLGSYDDDSSSPGVEETEDGIGSDERALAEEGLGADPFVAGTIFER